MGPISDFLFIGSAILPTFLFYCGEPALGAMALVFLLVAGGICAIGDPQAPHRQAKRPDGK